MLELIYNEDGTPFGWFVLPDGTPPEQKLKLAKQHREEMRQLGVYRRGEPA